MPFKELELDQSTEQKSNYMTELANEHHENIQQAEASNRWKQLEVVASFQISSCAKSPLPFSFITITISVI